MICNKYTSLNFIGEKYFIRQVDNKNMYMSFTSEAENKITLNMCEGLTKAVVFSKKSADELVSTYQNIEKVPAIKVLPNDGSLN